MYRFTPDVEMTDADSMKTKRSRREEELNCREEALVVIKRFKRVKWSEEPKEPPPAKRVKRFKVSEEEGFNVSEEVQVDAQMDALCAAFAKMVLV